MFDFDAVTMRLVPPGEPCSAGDDIEGRLMKHCWHDPRPRDREPYHADSTDQPRDAQGKFLPFTDRLGNLDSFSHLRQHHRTKPYFTNCIYVPCEVNVSDGVTRAAGSNEYTYGDGDRIYVGGCCGTGYVVTFVTIEIVNGVCWKKVHVVRDTFYGCFPWEEVPTTLYATLCGQSVAMTQAEGSTQWTGQVACSCGDTFLLRMNCRGLTLVGGGPNHFPAGFEYNVSGVWEPAAWPVDGYDSCNPLLINNWKIQGPNCGLVSVVVSE